MSKKDDENGKPGGKPERRRKYGPESFPRVFADLQSAQLHDLREGIFDLATETIAEATLEASPERRIELIKGAVALTKACAALVTAGDRHDQALRERK